MKAAMGGAIKRVLIEREKPASQPPSLNTALLPNMTVCVGCQNLTKRVEHLERKLQDLVGVLAGGMKGFPAGVYLDEGGPIPVSKETLDNLRHLLGYVGRRG